VLAGTGPGALRSGVEPGPDLVGRARIRQDQIVLTRKVPVKRRLRDTRLGSDPDQTLCSKALGVLEPAGRLRRVFTRR
jgi:hypothetical protein